MLQCILTNAKKLRQNPRCGCATTRCSTPPPSAGLKSCPIPTSPPLQGGKNPCGAKRGGVGLAGRGKITILKYSWRFLMDICD